jgi:hypothetical protein
MVVTSLRGNSYISRFIMPLAFETVEDLLAGHGIPGGVVSPLMERLRRPFESECHQTRLAALTSYLRLHELSESSPRLDLNGMRQEPIAFYESDQLEIRWDLFFCPSPRLRDDSRLQELS